ncbi:MAG: leucyl aminopeptidase [Gemmatimonas sp.]
MKISFLESRATPSGALVLPFVEPPKDAKEAKWPEALARYDRDSGGALSRAAKAGRFKGRKGQTLTVLAPANLEASRVVLVGLGASAKVSARTVEEAAGAAIASLLRSGETEATVLLDALPRLGLSPEKLAAHFALGARLRSWTFDKYRTKQKDEDKPTLANLKVRVGNVDRVRAAYAPLEAVAEGVELTRTVVSEPANVIYPETLAKAAQQALTPLGVKVEILGVPEMKKLNMGALLGVAQGSAREPRLVIMRWRGPGARDQQPVAFLGKGVTFDTGGISIKPSKGMEDMKWDMAGAGAVIGLMRALALRKARADVIGIVGLVENMPSGTAQRPGDVVKTASGQTVEVLNTDAEGRLVLADALWYCQERFKPRFMVDLATLTGAIIVSLGHEYAGLFASDDRLAQRLASAGDAVGERLWRMPLDDAYDKQINSAIADVQNIGANGAAGSITAAHFLKRFTNNVPWAHLDIAGVAWTQKDRPLAAKGATAFGVRLMDRMVADHYEVSAGKAKR